MIEITSHMTELVLQADEDARVTMIQQLKDVLKDLGEPHDDQLEQLFVGWW